MKKLVFFLLVSVLFFVSCDNGSPNTMEVCSPQIQIFNGSKSDVFLEVKETPIGEHFLLGKGKYKTFYLNNLKTYEVVVIEKGEDVYIKQGSEIIKMSKGRKEYSFTLDMKKPLVYIVICDGYAKVSQSLNAYDTEVIEYETPH